MADRQGRHPGVAARLRADRSRSLRRRRTERVRSRPAGRWVRRRPGRGARRTCRVGRARRTPALVRRGAVRPDSIHRSSAAGQPIRRRGPGILCRRDDGAAHRRPCGGARTPRDLAHIGHALQDGTEAAAGRCARAAGGRHHRRHGDGGGRPGRVNARLVTGPTGEVVWAQSFERDLRDVLDLQRELARRITSWSVSG